jgi:hypothetical protein
MLGGGFSAEGRRRPARGATERERKDERNENGNQRDERHPAIHPHRLNPNAIVTTPYARGDHEEGQLIGSSAGLKQLSERSGSFRRRILKRVYLPISPGSETRISITAPARSARSKR